MKVSVNWLKMFLDFELPPVDELVEKIGAQLGAVEEVEYLGKKYRGIPVVKVVQCEPLENSDHLHKCLIDDGGAVKDVERSADGLVQVLTGAPNVRKDMLAVWLAPGMTVPDSYGTDEPFVLQAREMRGAMSNGMLASMRELALGDSHEGLIEIDKDVAPGTPFAEVYKLDDYIIDIENKMFTHRPDCFGALGVAREVAGILGHQFKSPEWYVEGGAMSTVDGHRGVPLGGSASSDGTHSGAALSLRVQNNIPEKVPRFTAFAIKDVKVSPSPLWLQVALLKVGAKPINNIVDLTNFYMLLTGQPLHAYDYDKVATGTLGARFAKDGEKLALLNGKTVELTDADMVITDGAKAIGLAGVMGGEETEVSNETKNIILECATFNMYAIRRTSMRHGLFTDAVTRFNKSQSPLQNLAVLARITEDITKMAGGVVASQLVDENHAQKSNYVSVAVDFVNTRLGLNLSLDDMKQLLESVEFQVEATDGALIVTAPFWRTDIELPEDIVEEVGRLYGFDKLPLELPKHSITPVAKNTTLELKQQIRDRLVRAGANEVLTYSFVHGDLLNKAGQNPGNAFQVDNALSPDLQYYRLSLVPSLLDKIHGNIKAGYDEFAMFEIGKSHIAGQNGEDGLPREDDMVALVVTASDKLKKQGAAYYQAQKYLRKVVSPVKLAFKPIPEDMQEFDITKPYDIARSAFIYTLVGDKFLGIIGEFRGGVRRALKLPQYTAGFEIDTLALQGLVDYQQYIPIPRFPKVTQDITLKVKADLPYQTLYDFVAKAVDEAVHNIGGSSQRRLDERDIYQAPDDVAHKQVTFRLEIASYDRTLTDKEVNALLDSVAEAAKSDLDAERV